jgi:hypothetical protein
MLGIGANFRFGCGHGGQSISAQQGIPDIARRSAVAKIVVHDQGSEQPPHGQLRWPWPSPQALGQRPQGCQISASATQHRVHGNAGRALDRRSAPPRPGKALLRFRNRRQMGRYLIGKRRIEPAAGEAGNGRWQWDSPADKNSLQTQALSLSNPLS